MKKTVTGSHSGTGWWLVQRISAVLVLLAAIPLLILFIGNAPFDYAGWQAAFDFLVIKLLVLVLVASLCLHAWIGLRDVLMDYVQPIFLRLFLNVAILLILFLCTTWATVILWGGHG